MRTFRCTAARSCAAALLCAMVLPATAHARVLPGGLDDDIEALFAPLAPALTLEQGAISADGARLTFCDAKGACALIVLSDPEPSCAFERLGPWCVKGVDKLPVSADAMRALLSADTQTYWQEVTAHAPMAAPEAPPPPPAAPALALAVAMVLAMAAVGWLLGAQVGARAGGRRRRAALVLAGSVLTLFAISELALAWIDLWDGLLYTGVLLAAALVALADVGALGLAVAAVAVIVGLVGAELAVRALTPPGGALPTLDYGLLHRPDPWAAGATQRTWHWDHYACDALFGDGLEAATQRGAAVRAPAPGATPDPAPGAASAETAQAAAGASVGRLTAQASGEANVSPTLHLGDSMVHGIAVGADQTLVARLAASQPEVEHVGVGLPGTSVDAALVLARRMVDTLRPRRVVYYVFPGNDLEELDAPLPCCEGEPLLDRSAAGQPTACDAQRPRLLGSRTLTMLWQLSPAPYALRALAHHSALAATSWRVLRAGHHQQRYLSRSEDERWAAYEATLQALVATVRGHAATIELVVMPVRADVCAEAPSATPSATFKRRLRALAQREGVRVHDAWSFFADASAGERQRWFVSAPTDDPHLSPEGHAAVASWLAPRLRERHRAAVGGPAEHGPPARSHR